MLYNIGIHLAHIWKGRFFMLRRSFFITEKQLAALKVVSEREGIQQAEVLRNVITAWLESLPADVRSAIARSMKAAEKAKRSE
jgi:hypothetical protein